MVPSGRLTILFILLLLSPVALSQSVADKAATSTVSGKVTVGGKGLQGVVVVLVIVEQSRSIFRPTRFRSTTDEDGNYRITNVQPGTYEVVPASPTYVATEGRKSLIVGKNETVENIDIALERGGVITGKVTDAEGRPVIEEMVFLSAATSQRAYYLREIRTDDRGIYRAYGVPPGKYTVSAGRDARSSPGRRHSNGGYERTYHPSTADPAAATVIDVTDGGEATNVDITLGGPPRTYTARGRIIDGDTNQPVPNTQVGLQSFFQFGTSARGNVAESTKDGEFKVENLAPGKYAVYSQPPENSNWHSEAVQFEVTDRDVDGLVIKTSGGASVSGVVVLEGPVDEKLRANLLASRIVGLSFGGYVGQSTPSATINPNGTFRMTGLAPGRLIFNLEPREPFRVSRVERDGIVNPRGVEIKEREHVTGLRVVVAHANGAIRGVIKRPSGLEPAVARVQAHVRRPEDFYATPVDIDVLGQFRVNGLIPGTYEIEVMVFRNVPAAQQPLIIPPTRHTVIVTNGAVADVNITLQMPKPAQ
ncbi:MAG TPA: carboxypeptidase-like regulatory domain-containing protein [Pyrinomonadaceae bacterium]